MAYSSRTKAVVVVLVLAALLLLGAEARPPGSNKNKDKKPGSKPGPKPGPAGPKPGPSGAKTPSPSPSALRTPSPAEVLPEGVFPDLKTALASTKDDASTSILIKLFDIIGKNPLFATALNQFLSQQSTFLAPNDKGMTNFLASKNLTIETLPGKLMQQPLLVLQLLAPYVVAGDTILTSEMVDGGKITTGIAVATFKTPGADLTISKKEGEPISLAGPKNTVKIIVKDLLIRVGPTQAVVHVIDDGILT